MARSGARVYGVEGEESLVRRGQNNAKLNQIDNVDFSCFDLYSNNLEKLGEKVKFNKMLVDPPRSGALEVITQLVPKLNPEMLVYVSCNPATLARDCEIITAIPLAMPG